MTDKAPARGNPATRRDSLASELGLPPRRLTNVVLAEISQNPLFVHHLELCRDDPALLDLLLRDTGESPAAADMAAPELLARASKAMARWAASGFQRVGRPVYLARLDTCRACPHLTEPPATFLHKLTGTAHQKTVCGQCGCDVRRKAWLATESCPDGRWETQNTQDKQDYQEGTA